MHGNRACYGSGGGSYAINKIIYGASQVSIVIIVIIVSIVIIVRCLRLWICNKAIMLSCVFNSKVYNNSAQINGGGIYSKLASLCGDMYSQLTSLTVDASQVVVHH